MLAGPIGPPGSDGKRGSKGDRGDKGLPVSTYPCQWSKASANQIFYNIYGWCVVSLNGSSVALLLMVTSICFYWKLKKYYVRM